ncbi:hypothetical protein ACGFI3_46125 [Nonomuraea wenchangensis]|uniref:hypothetical protein n=1 Tax=Nonomuraea wenchangensis TaxID=568860 RepID=UPI003722A930
MRRRADGHDADSERERQVTAAWTKAIEHEAAWAAAEGKAAAAQARAETERLRVELDQARRQHAEEATRLREDLAAAQSATQTAIQRAEVAETRAAALQEAKVAAEVSAREAVQRAEAADARAGEVLALLRQDDTPA